MRLVTGLRGNVAVALTHVLPSNQKIAIMLRILLVVLLRGAAQTPGGYSELPHVILQSTDRGPAEQRMADGLQSLLVFHDTLPLMGMPSRLAMHIAGKDRAARACQIVCVSA